MKKMNKIILVFVAIIALFFVTSCAEQAAGPDLTKAYIGGTVGLNTYLIEGMPPAMIHDAGTFPFGVGIVKNIIQEEDVNTGMGTIILYVETVTLN